MKISIVVPFHNEARYLDACIEALLSQDFPRERFNIVMVDNNSTDGSADIVSRYAEVVLLSETIQGDYAARNRGISDSSGEIIAFTDADTAPASDWLRQIERTMNNEEVMLLIGGLKFGNESASLELAARYEEEKTHFVYSRDEADTYFGYTCNMAVRRTAFERLGLFPPVQRNSEIVFLRSVIDAYSTRALRYAPDALVQRLEIASLSDYLSKLHTYGRDYRRYGKVASLRPLNTRERIEIFKRTVRRNSYSWRHAMRLLTLLVTGGIAYESGRLLSRTAPNH